MLHASNNSSAMFTSALRRLAAHGLHVVAFDLPNYGESMRTRGEPKIVDIADIVLQAVQALRFARTFDIVSTC